MPYSLKSIGDANLPITLVSATYTALDTDYIINATSGTFNITLPTTVGITNKLYIIKNSGTGVITIVTTGSQTIDGSSASINLTQNTSISIQSDGSNWIITTASATGNPTEIQYNKNGSFASSSNLTYDDSTNTFLSNGISALRRKVEIGINADWVFVSRADDLPAAVGGVITLLDNITYMFVCVVDLQGDRLVCGDNTTLLGGSSENCRILSTGLTGQAMISSVYSLPIRNLTIEADVALNLAGNVTTSAIDWFGVNFTNCNTIGVIRDYANVIMTDCAFLESASLTFDGTIGTVGFAQCLFNGTTGNTIFILPPSLTISRRFRIIYSSFVVLSGETGINVSTTATIPADAYILTYCNFSGGGTYLAGHDHTSNKALFINNVGITNSSNVGHYYMQNNATATTGIVQNTYLKAAGTTVVGAGNSPKWTTATTNRLTYAGTITTEFIITVVGSVQSAANNSTIGVGVAENGTIIAESRVSIRAAVAGTPMPFATQDVIQVATGDFFEIWVTNETGTQAITLTDLNVIIQKVTG